MGFGFEDFPDLENGETFSSKRKLDWKRDLHCVETLH